MFQKSETKNKIHSLVLDTFYICKPKVFQTQNTRNDEGGIGKKFATTIVPPWRIRFICVLNKVQRTSEIKHISHVRKKLVNITLK